MRFRRQSWLVCVVLTTVITGLTGSAMAGIGVGNDSFESPANIPGGYQYAGSSSLAGNAWTFAGGSGIAANGSAFGVSTPFGNQAGFLQNGNGTLGGVSITQAVTLPAGPTTLYFYLEGRPNYGANGVEFYLNGTDVKSIAPSSITVGSFTEFSVFLGTLTAGTYTIGFAGNNAGLPSNESYGPDYTTFVDKVTTPEPASLVVWGVAIGCGLFVARRRPKA